MGLRSLPVIYKIRIWVNFKHFQAVDMGATYDGRRVAIGYSELD